MFEVDPVRVDRDEPSDRAAYQSSWVPFPAGIEAVKAMASLIKRPHEGRPQNLAIVGGPNFGKSHLLDYFVDRYPDLPDEACPRIQVLSIEAPPKADGAALLRELLSQMGAPYNSRQPLDELLRRFCVRAEALRILMFVIDEFHNGAWGRRDAAMTYIQTVRAISNRLRRPIVVAGTEKINDVLRNDQQLSERFRRISMPQWSEENTVRELLGTFETKLPTPRPSNLADPVICKAVTDLAGPKLGRIAVLLREAHQIALSKGEESIRITHIEAAGRILGGTK